MTQPDPWAALSARVSLRPGERCGQCESCRWGRGQACDNDPRRQEQLVSDGRLRRRREDGTWELVK